MANIRYKTHIQDQGWEENWKEDGQISGTTGLNRQLESIMIDPQIDGVTLEYQLYVENHGWMAPVKSPHAAGTTGENRAIEAIQIKVEGEKADQYECWYRVHVADVGYMDWVNSNSGIAGSMEGDKQIEAIQIYLMPKNSMYLASDTSENFIKYERPKPAPEPPPQPPAPPIDHRMALLNAARSYLGYTSGTSQDSAFGRRIAGARAGDWCCYFVVCCAQDAGVNVPVTGYVPTMHQWAINNGRFTGVPEPGFFALFDFNGNGTCDHIGIVENVYSSNDVDTIEGNTGSPVGVYRKQRSAGLVGYINPF